MNRREPFENVNCAVVDSKDHELSRTEFAPEDFPVQKHWSCTEASKLVCTDNASKLSMGCAGKKTYGLIAAIYCDMPPPPPRIGTGSHFWQTHGPHLLHPFGF